MDFLSRHVTLVLLGLPLFVFVGMMLFFLVGRRAKLRRLAGEPQTTMDDLGAVKAAIFGLLGLLIAFTFAGAAGRIEKRRDLAVQEAIAIGNAWNCVDTLPPATQPPIREGLRSYVESRLETYRLVPDLDAVMAEAQHSSELADGIWREAVTACETPRGQPVRLLVLRGLEGAFNLFQIRVANALHHPPWVVWAMLFLLAMLSAWIAGYGVSSPGRSNRTYMTVFALTTAIAVYVILDMEFPRAGMVTVDASDQMLASVLERMK